MMGLLCKRSGGEAKPDVLLAPAQWQASISHQFRRGEFRRLITVEDAGEDGGGKKRQAQNSRHIGRCQLFLERHLFDGQALFLGEPMANPVRPRQQTHQAVIGVALSFAGDDEPQLVSGATQGCGNTKMKRIAVSGRCWLSDGAVLHRIIARQPVVQRIAIEGEIDRAGVYIDPGECRQHEPAQRVGAGEDRLCDPTGALRSHLAGCGIRHRICKCIHHVGRRFEKADETPLDETLQRRCRDAPAWLVSCDDFFASSLLVVISDRET